MNILERDLEEIIFNTDSKLLLERGLLLYGKRKRQLRLGSAGIADIVTMERPKYNVDKQCHEKGVLTVFELKKDKVSISAFMQAVGYIEFIRKYLERRGRGHWFDYRIGIIGSSIDRMSNFIHLTNFIERYDQNAHGINCRSRFFIDLITFSIEIEGFTFNSHTSLNPMNNEL